MESLKENGNGSSEGEVREKILKSYEVFCGEHTARCRVPEDAINIEIRSFGEYGKGFYVAYQRWEYAEVRKLGEFVNELF